LGEASIACFCGKHMLSYAQTPQKHMARHIEGPQGYTGGPNWPAAVLWRDTRGGAAAWKCAVSRNQAVLDQIFCRTPYCLRLRSTTSGLGTYHLWVCAPSSLVQVPVSGT
jgi:hypothetical protein